MLFIFIQFPTFGYYWFYPAEIILSITAFLRMQARSKSVIKIGRSGASRDWSSFSVKRNSSLGLRSPLPWASSLLSLHFFPSLRLLPRNPTISLIHFAKQCRLLSLSRSILLCFLPPFRPSPFPKTASTYFPKQNVFPHTNYTTTQVDGSCRFCFFVIDNNSLLHPQKSCFPLSFQVLYVVHVIVF